MQPCPSLHLSTLMPQGVTQEINMSSALGFYTGHFTQECHHHFLVSCSPNHPLGKRQTETRINLA